MPDILLTMFDGIYLESVIHHAGVDPPAPQSPIRRREKWSSGDMASDNFNGFDFKRVSFSVTTYYYLNIDTIVPWSMYGKWII